MSYAIAADAVVALHFLFVVYATAGGALVIRWPMTALAHLPCGLWAAGIMFTGTVCPLTPLENRLRMRAGQEGYDGGFIEQYLLPVLYPAGLTRTHQVLLGTFVLLLNLAFYLAAWRRLRQKKDAREGAKAQRRDE